MVGAMTYVGKEKISGIPNLRGPAEPDRSNI